MMSGVLAGWLMGLLSWLATAARDTINQNTNDKNKKKNNGLAHQHHTIVGSTEVLAGVIGGHGVTLGE